MFVQNIVLPIVYFFYARQKVQKGLVVFADAHHKECPFSMQYLLNELKKTDYKIKEVYRDYRALSPFSMAKEMMAFMKLYAKAEYVVICDNFIPVASCNKRKETKVIQLWHGCGAFKKFGYDTQDDIPSYYKGNVFKNYDLVTVSAKVCVAPFASAMRQPEGVVKAIGVSRTDELFDNDYNKQCIEAFYEEYPHAKGKKVVLYAPTFRGAASDGKSADLEVIEQLKKELEEDYFVITKLHPHVEKMLEHKSKFTTEQLFAVADVLITDYSSIIFDYAIYKKTLVLYVPDLESYADKRGFYLDFASLPAEIAKNKEELKQAVIKESTSPSNERMEEFYQTYMNACDGHATARIIGWMKERLY